LPIVKEGNYHVWHLFVVKLVNRTKVQKVLNESGVATMIHYPIAPHVSKSYEDYKAMELPISKMLSETVLSIPMDPSLKYENVEKVINTLNLATV
jgi:dTDP-4-amino-4,6-dideoxygalactose transaminase